MLKGKRQVVYVMLITAILFYSCEKEVSSDMVVERNGLTYEVNSEIPFSGKAVEFFEGGEVKSKSTSYKDGKLDGVLRIWFENGQISSEDSYKDGLMHGTSGEWYDNGQKKMDMKFKDGLESGDTRVWYENGQLWAETSWKDGKINGTFMSWQENGQPDTEEHYKDDILHGVKKRWHKNGQLQIKTIYKNDLLHGPAKSWYENGQAEMEFTFIENEEDGIFREWYENGSLKSEGKYLKGQKVGDWAYRGQNGQVGVVDIDGNIYETVKLGDQVWMTENLKVTHYRNGDPIPTDWPSFSGAFTIYGNDLPNAEIYGNLYNWHAVSDSRNIAPEGWHVPTDAEWQELEMAIGMSQSEADDTRYRGRNEGSKLAGNAALWISGSLENDSEFGASGFTALPGGIRATDGGYFYMGEGASFWSATESNSYRAWFHKLSNERSGVLRNDYGWRNGFSVRCVKD